jgi:hypothetical protein
MKLIIMHWSAGGHKASALDRKHYHFIVEGDGTVVAGDKPPEANLSTKDDDYAAHTLGANTGAIGVAVAAMAGAVERPFNAGRAPITPAQVDALAELCRDLCKRYNIPVTRETVLSHAEVQPTLGIKQKGKWDIAWLPGMERPGDPVQVGDTLRNMIRLAPAAPAPLSPKPVDDSPAPDTDGNWLVRLIRAIFWPKNSA